MRIKKVLKRMFIGFVLFLTVIATVAYFYLQQPQFGKLPSGERLERITKSPNYKDGQFQNLSPSPLISEGYGYGKAIYDYFFVKGKNLRTIDSIPSVKKDLKSLPKERDLLVWFGHSSYLMQLDGKTFLADPVFNNFASPNSYFNKAFNVTSTYQVEDLPPIDYLLISHDHYDHLDYTTIKQLKDKVGNVVCGLGVGEHFEYWGYNPSQIIEKDWWDTEILDSNITLHFTPARHYSGRGLKSNRTLWTSYVIETSSKKIFVGGDSGYDTHFSAIGKKFGRFDLAIMENGQYGQAWRNIHAFPEDAIQATKDLNAKKIFPVHSSKFKLANHPWNEPLTKIAEMSKKAGISLMTPLIGQVVEIDDTTQIFSNWWENVN